MNFPTWLLANGTSLQVPLFFALLFSLFVAERLIPRRPRHPRAQQWWANAQMTLLNIVALSVVPVSFFAIAQWAVESETGLLNTLPLAPSLAVIATLLLRGLLSTGTHLLMHQVPLLWRIHRVHHLDTDLDVTTTVRFHPFEIPIGLAIGAPFIFALGFVPWVLVLYELLDLTVTLFSHANIRVPASVERVLRYIIVTPELHRIHHSSYQPETDSNYGAVFPIWDILLGTFCTSTREPHETMELGLEVRDSGSYQIGRLLLSPFERVRTQEARDSVVQVKA